jgi:DNA-binding response OmpR family regulator
MIIDDSKLIRMTVRKFLEDYGVAVVELDRVEPLLEEPWRAHDINLLILDINLSGIDGISALQSMKRNETLRTLPVMILTAVSDRSTVCKAIAFGAVEFMTKPIVREELIGRIENVIGPLNDGVNDSIRKEISRAKRGKTELSIIRISFEKSTQPGIIRDTQLQLQGILRSIDSVLVSRDRAIIIILPVTGRTGSLVVSKSIIEAIEGRTDVSVNFFLSQAVYPDNGDSADALLLSLKEEEIETINNGWFSQSEIKA